MCLVQKGQPETLFKYTKVTVELMRNTESAIIKLMPCCIHITFNTEMPLNKQNNNNNHIIHEKWKNIHVGC